MYVKTEPNWKRLAQNGTRIFFLQMMDNFLFSLVVDISEGVLIVGTYSVLLNTFFSGHGRETP